MKHHHTTRLNSPEHEQTLQQTAQVQSAVEFATTDEMLRYDAAQTPVPPAVAGRLQESVTHEAPPPRAWWRRWLGG